MGRKVAEKHEHGEFICEWVEEMLPLGEDRKTIFVPAVPVEIHLRQQTVGTGAMLAAIMNSIAAKYGDEVWEVANKAMYDLGRRRGQRIVQTMKIDPEDARSVGRIFDLEDDGAGNKGEWVETGKKRAVKRELVCPMARSLSACPEVCERLFDAYEKGTLDAVGARVKDFHFGKLIPKGDPYCEVILELED